MINNGKAKIENTFNGINIIVPSKKNWFLLVFATVWMGGWFFGFIAAAGALSFISGAHGFLFFWLTGWTVGGIAVCTTLLWGYFGLEKFLTDNDQILFEKTVFGFGIKKIFDRSQVKNFRFGPVSYNRFVGNRYSMWGFGPGKIKFDYGLKTYSFGLGVDDAEANYIVGLLNEQFN